MDLMNDSSLSTDRLMRDRRVRYESVTTRQLSYPKAVTFTAPSAVSSRYITIPQSGAQELAMAALECQYFTCEEKPLADDV